MVEHIVVGGGLAGLACAFELAEQGREVLVLEAGAHVGGRAASWIEDGMPVESGLHRFLGHYTELPALMRRAGIDIDRVLCWEDEMEVRLPDGGRAAVFGAAPMHEPAKTLLGALGNNDFLSPLDKASLLPFFTAGLAEYLLRPERLDRWTVAEYARRFRVTSAALERLLVPLTAGVFFLPPDRYSAYALFGLLAPALRRPYRIRLGAFMGGMTDVMTGPIAAAIVDRGGTVRTDAPVDALIREGDRIAGVVVGGERLTARHVVLATSLAPAQALLRAHVEDHPWFGPMLALPSMPAATIQLELDAPSMPLDRTTFAPHTALASFAEQSRTTFRHTPGRLSIILSPPEEFLDADPDAVLKRVLDDADRLGLDLAGHVTRFRLVTHPADFYALTPGSDALRPSQRTPIEGLTLAGDYTRQPLLATMEGAVISGRRAARAAMT